MGKNGIINNNKGNCRNIGWLKKDLYYNAICKEISVYS